MIPTDDLRAAVHRFRECNDFAAAAEAAHRVLSRDPADRAMLRLLGECCLLAGHVLEAEKVYRLDLEAGTSAHALTGLARARAAAGDMAAATRLARQALSLDPGHRPTWATLGELHRFRAADPLIAKARRLLKAADIPASLRVTLHHVLCKAMDDLGKWDRAWDHAAKAHAECEGDYDPMSIWRWMEGSRTAFPASAFSGGGHPSTAPIFVVGMPRSGTTLVEAILSAGLGVTGMGELPLVPQLCAERGRDPGWATSAPEDAFVDMGQRYLDDVARRAGGQVPTRFTDKLPGNAFHLGPIGRMFPAARIVEVVRDPLDTCTSCYLGRFARGHEFVHRLDWLADAWRAYRGAVDDMRPRLPNPMLTICYEDLVRAPEQETRRLADFLDLDWTPACLTPGQTAQHVVTRSQAQVRQDINTRSVGRWRRYRRRIAPLAEALGIDLNAALAA